MTTKSSEGAGHAPGNGLPTVYSNDTNIYIKDGFYIDKEFETLQQHPLVKEFANVNADTYDLVAHTNPTLKLLFDVCRDIVKEGGK